MQYHKSKNYLKNSINQIKTTISLLIKNYFLIFIQLLNHPKNSLSNQLFLIYLRKPNRFKIFLIV